MFQKFYFLPENILSFLFKTYCNSFYGLNLWFEEQVKVGCFKKLEIAYHKAVKRVAKMDVWQSNHEACEKVGVNIFKHFFSVRLIKYYFSVINARCQSMKNLKYYMMLKSHLHENLTKRISHIYDVNCIFSNDKQALLARIFFVERNEPRSNYVYEPIT